jgi:hypothetical protein
MSSYFLSSAYTIDQIDPGRMYMLAREQSASGVREGAESQGYTRDIPPVPTF